MKLRVTRRLWQRYVALAVLLGGGATAIDIPLHAWPQLGIELAATGTTLFFARRGMRVAEATAEWEAHRPDYAKIARLEIELGLVEPPKPPPKGGPFIDHVPPGRRETYQAPKYEPQPNRVKRAPLVDPPKHGWNSYHGPWFGE